MPRILVVDDEDDMRDDIVVAVRDAVPQAERVEVRSMTDALAEAQKGAFDLAVVDLSLLGQGLDEQGVDLIRWLHIHQPACKSIAVTSTRGNDGGKRALQAGAADFVNRLWVEFNWIELLKSTVRRFAAVG